MAEIEKVPVQVLVRPTQGQVEELVEVGHCLDCWMKWVENHHHRGRSHQQRRPNHWGQAASCHSSQFLGQGGKVVEAVQCWDRWGCWEDRLQDRLEDSPNHCCHHHHSLCLQSQIHLKECPRSRHSPILDWMTQEERSQMVTHWIQAGHQAESRHWKEKIGETLTQDFRWKDYLSREDYQQMKLVREE